MFSVKMDDYILYDYRLDDLEHEDMVLESPKLSFEANKTNSFQFKIYSTHRYFELIKKLKSIIKVYHKGELIFRGRVLEDTQGFNKSKNVDVEGELAFLFDSIYRPYNFTGQTKSLKDFIIDLINNHNSQVKEWQRFKIGVIDIEDPNGKINFSSESDTKTWKVFEEKIIPTYGGYIFITYDENEMPIFNIYKDLPYTNITNIEYGINLLDISNLISASDLFTACIPRGAKITDENGQETGERVTISSVNNGLDYLIDEEKAEEFGIIYADSDKVTFDDVNVPSNLLTKGNQALADGIKLAQTLEIKANYLTKEEDIQNFKFLYYTNVISLKHGINERYLLEKLDLDLFNISNTQITLGKVKKTLTDNSLTNKVNADQFIKTINEINSNYTTNEKVTTIINQELKNSTIIEQKASEVTIAALQNYTLQSNFNEYQEINSSSLQVLAEEIVANFTTTKSSIENVDGDLQQKYEELKSLIRGYQNSEGQPVIELGESQSTIKLKLENDEIYFDVNGMKSFYLDANGEIHFKNAVFEDTTEVGNGFGFVPRSNGNLSFKKVRK